WRSHAWPNPFVLPLPPTQVYNPPLHRLTGHHAHEMRAPTLERPAALLKVDGLVVDAGDAALVATGMTENHLHDVRRDAEAVMQRSRDRPAKIVQGPGRQSMARFGNTRVEFSLGS